MVRLPSLALWLAIGVFAARPALAADGAANTSKVEFNRDIRPILADTCFKCHGFDKNSRKADLRLDLQEAALAVKDGAAPIVAGHPEQSEIFLRMTSTDPTERMPPPASRLSLKPAQIELVQRWIEQGAEYQPHWAFIAPRQAPLPAVKQADWPRNPIDHFIAARLEQGGLAPSPEAEKSTLLRRVTLDLTGLPPTLVELDDFLADGAPDAYERAVDRLLASPRYGERMVLEWLDAARYADTNGYQGDRTRTMWPWRDWAIRALNDNLPFDEFTIQQLAGDLLPNPTLDQRIATGFNRNHPLNGEGGRIAEESRNDYVMDRVETVGMVWLGLTVGCCRCHDHKYDPLLQKEYYQLFAYFNNVAETGAVDAQGNANPVLKIISPEEERQIASLRERVAAAESQLQAALPQIDAAQREWELSLQMPHWSVLDVVQGTAMSGAALTKQEDKSLLAAGAPPASTDVYELVFRTDLAGVKALRVKALRVEALPHESLPASGPGRAENGNFILTTLDAEIALPGTPAKKMGFASAIADYAQSATPVSAAIDGDAASGWGVDQAPNKEPRVAVFTFAEPFDLTGNTDVRIRLKFESRTAKTSLGRFRLSLSTDAAAPVSAQPLVAAALAVPADQRTDTQRGPIRDFYRAQFSTPHRDLSAAITAARKQLTDYENSRTQTMVMQDLPQPRETWILLRGVYDKHGDPVTPGVPSMLPPLSEGVPNSRLEFARWLVAPSNPLTARVTVNRHWQTFFGTGLVKTTEDFGVQGELPSHPELLDWLAVEFQRGGWNVKTLHRMFVTSAAYRQSSRATPQLLERDPDNRLLARGPRHRLPSFVIRDQALALGGLLTSRVGGAPAKPYQPDGVWEDATLGKIRYERDRGEGLYRRSLYTFWRRISSPTMLFDTSARSVCTVRLPRTNTPLQALILMNDVQYVEAARGLATRMLIEGGATPAERIAFAFRLATSRAPTEQERSILVQAYEGLRQRFVADPEGTQKYLSQGDSPRPPQLDATELAAYTAVASLIMNLDETITNE